MRARGFTLVELLVVLVILALVLALLPRFISGGQERVELQSETSALASALRETRGRALRDGKTASTARAAPSARWSATRRRTRCPRAFAWASSP
jgi:prepilin-type N-terminal cleavage/methylation domain-containing protein